MADVRQHYAVVKSAAKASVAKGKGRSGNAAAGKEPAAEQAVAPQEQSVSLDEDLFDEQVAARVLRDFDFTTKFGPMSGMTRLQRWERAQRCDLDPPAHVQAILQHFGPDSPLNQPVFFAR